MNKIYGENSGSGPEGSTLTNEVVAHNIEDKFVDEVCNQITEILGISYQDRKIFKAVLKKAIGKDIDSVNQYDGLLQQHGAYVLDKSSKRIIDALNLGDVKVNHEYAAHAKFADIIKVIKDKYISKTVEKVNTEKFAETLLNENGAEAVHELAHTLIKLANADVNKLEMQSIDIGYQKRAISEPAVIDYRDERLRQKQSAPPNIMHMVATYKARIKELENNNVSTISEYSGIAVEIRTLKGVVADLSSWIIYNY